MLGVFFVYQLDVSYLWLTGILTAASFVLGILLLVRAVRLKESKLVLFGTISGLVVSADHGAGDPGTRRCSSMSSATTSMRPRRPSRTRPRPRAGSQLENSLPAPDFR